MLGIKEKKPHICPKCNGNKKVGNNSAEVNLCMQCSGIFVDILQRTIIRDWWVPYCSQHYCAGCQQKANKIPSRIDCHICEGAGIVWG